MPKRTLHNEVGSDIAAPKVCNGSIAEVTLGPQSARNGPSCSHFSFLVMEFLNVVTLSDPLGSDRHYADFG
jgi:hypothetical protein